MHFDGVVRCGCMQCARHLCPAGCLRWSRRCTRVRRRSRAENVCHWALGATFHLSARPKSIKSLDWRSLSLRRFLRAALKRFHLAEPLINLRLLDAAAFSAAATDAARFHGNEKLKVSSLSPLLACSRRTDGSDSERHSQMEIWCFEFCARAPADRRLAEALSDAISLICYFLPSFNQRF